MADMSLPADTRSAAILALRSTDPVLRGRLGYGAFVGVRYPYLYLETPKAACTTTKAHLWRLEGLGPLPHPNSAHARPKEDPRPSLLTIGEARAVEALCGAYVFRFCVWREPVRRLASTYMAKIRLVRDPGVEWVYYRRVIADRFGLGSEKEITFDHFVRFVCALPDERREPHFMSQYRLSLAHFVRYDRIVRVDRYADDMAAVCRDIGVPPSLWPDFHLRENISGSEAIEISKSSAAMIRDAFRQDYEMLGSG
jgi:hypothetical protein